MVNSKADLIHIRVGTHLRKEMDELIELGIFSNHSEITREGLRDLIIKYKEMKTKEFEEEEEEENKTESKTESKTLQEHKGGKIENN